MLRAILIGRSATRGATAVEFGLVFPFVLLAVLGLMEYSRAVWVRTMLDYAVQATARCVAVNATLCPINNQTMIRAYADAKGLPGGSTLSVTQPQPTCGVEVTASVPIDLLAPLLPDY